MNGRTQQLLLHLAGCLVFLALPMLFSPESLSLHAYWTNPPTQREFIAYVLVIAVFYLNYYGLIPRLYFQRRYLAFVLINLVCFIPISILPEAIVARNSFPANSFRTFPVPGNSGNPGDLTPARRPQPPAFSDPSPDSPSAAPPFDNRPPPENLSGPGLGFGPNPRARRFPNFFLLDINQHIFLFLVVIFFALMLKIRERWQQTEEEKVHAELSYLKAQINPHFLFNTLNSIYSLTLQKSDKAPAAVVQLSEMMRYVLHDTSREWVPLEKEIAYIRNYIELQQARFDDSIRLSFAVNGFPANLKIAPLILIAFIENAFKHGVNAEEDSDIRIRIDIGEDQLLLYVFNNKVTVASTAPEHPGPASLQSTAISIPAGHSGLGLTNTRQRLQHLYPGRHHLVTHDHKNDYSISLTLTLL